MCACFIEFCGRPSWTPKVLSRPSRYGWQWDTSVVSISAAGTQVIQQLCGFLIISIPSCRVRHLAISYDIVVGCLQIAHYAAESSASELTACRLGLSKVFLCSVGSATLQSGDSGLVVSIRTTISAWLPAPSDP